MNNFRYDNHIQIKFCRIVHSYKMHSLNYNFFQIPIVSWDIGPKLWHFRVTFGPKYKEMCYWKTISSWKKILVQWIIINNWKILWKFDTNTIICLQGIDRSNFAPFSVILPKNVLVGSKKTFFFIVFTLHNL